MVGSKKAVSVIKRGEGDGDHSLALHILAVFIYQLSTLLSLPVCKLLPGFPLKLVRSSGDF